MAMRYVLCFKKAGTKVINKCMLIAAMEKRLLAQQKNEITEYHAYRKIAARCKSKKNQKLMEKIADQERSHYDFWKKHTKQDVSPSMVRVWFYYILTCLFGVTFGIRLMERGEKQSQKFYAPLIKQIPRAKKILRDEQKHERELIRLFEEEKLKYVGSIVLGLNDALVELTGALAGLTLALQNTVLIADQGCVLHGCCVSLDGSLADLPVLCCQWCVCCAGLDYYECCSGDCVLQLLCCDHAGGELSQAFFRDALVKFRCCSCLLCRGSYCQDVHSCRYMNGPDKMIVLNTICCML